METKSQTKAWITSALSMKIRDNICKKFCKAKELNLKKQIQEKYKIYRNQIVTLTRVCKEKNLCLLSIFF